MIVPRSGHRAVLLNSGNVLFVCGRTPFRDERGNHNAKPTAEAELFDPRTNEFKKISPMNFARDSCTATHLNNGTVLITGGQSEYKYKGIGALASAEIFDPKTETFRLLAAQMTTPRRQHSAVLLPNGKVLIAGGSISDDLDVIVLNTVETFDPQTEQFAPAGNMLAPRLGFSAILLQNGKVLMVSGTRSLPEVFDPTNRTSKATENKGLGSGSLCLMEDGSVLKVGGYAEKNVEVYHPEKNRFSPMGSTQQERWETEMVRLPNGKVLIVGGASAKSFIIFPTEFPRESIEVFDPQQKTFQLAHKLPEQRNNYTATLLSNGKILIAGGYRYKDDKDEYIQRSWLYSFAEQAP